MFRFDSSKMNTRFATLRDQANASFKEIEHESCEVLIRND